MRVSEREGNYRNRMNLASGFMFFSSVYPHRYKIFFSLKSVLFYFSLLPRHSSHPALIYTNSFSLASFSSVPTPIFAKCYCQVHFPFLLFRLCFSHSALASLHLPAFPPTPPAYNSSSSFLHAPVHTHSHSFLWPCHQLWHLQPSDSGAPNFRPIPDIILPHRPPNLCAQYSS